MEGTGLALKLSVEVINMATSKIIKETHAIYALPFDENQLADHPVVLEHQGKPVAVVIAPEEYQAYREWRDADAWRRAELDKLRPGHEAFQRLLPELLRSHRDQFVAIHNGQVVGSDADNLALAQRVIARFGNEQVYIQKMCEQPRIFELPSPEEIPNASLRA